jgi:hypothetical protein
MWLWSPTPWMIMLQPSDSSLAWYQPRRRLDYPTCQMDRVRVLLTYLWSLAPWMMMLQPSGSCLACYQPSNPARTYMDHSDSLLVPFHYANPMVALISCFRRETLSLNLHSLMRQIFETRESPTWCADPSQGTNLSLLLL